MKKQLNVEIPIELYEWLDETYPSKTKAIIDCITKLQNGEAIEKYWVDKTWPDIRLNKSEILYKLKDIEFTDEIVIASALLRLPRKIVQEIKHSILSINPKAYALYKITRSNNIAMKAVKNTKIINSTITARFKSATVTSREEVESLVAAILELTGGILCRKKEEEEWKLKFICPVTAKSIAENLKNIGYSAEYSVVSKQASEQDDDYEAEVVLKF